jgi:integrase
VEDTTKTHQARSVPILTTALAETLESVVEGRDPREYLFPAPAGGPMRNSYFRHRFDKACKTAELEGVSIKSLRHTAGSLALAQGASVVTTQRLLGHKDATTTLRVYSHMLPDDFDTLAASMDKAVLAAPANS